MEEGISGLYREGNKKESMSPLSTGFPEPQRIDVVEVGTAGISSTSIPSTPVSPQKQSVRFDDQVGELQDEDDEKKKKKKGYKHILRFGFFPPRGVVGKVLTRLLAMFIWYGVLWGVLGSLALPAPVPEASHSSGAGITCNDSSKGHDDTVHYCTLNLSSALTSVVEYHCPNKMYKEDYIFQITISGANTTNSTNVTSGNEYLVETPHSVGEGSNHVNNSNVTSGDGDCKKSLHQECIENCLCEDQSHHEEHTLEGHFFGLFVLTIVSVFFGSLLHAIRLPHLFGMMIGGILLTNLPVVGVARNINHDWSTAIRTGALVVVLIRGGLSMELKALRTLFPPIAALGILPCICEALTVFLVTTWWTYEGQWTFGLMQGFLDSAISPSVLVPSLLNLEDHGYGVDEGIPTMLIVAAAFDDVLCISLFSVFLAVIFNSGPLVFSILRGPLEIVLGLVYGVGCGLLMWYIPPKDFKKGAIVRNRLTFLLGLALFAFFAAQRMKFFDSPGFIGAGALGILTLAFVASIGWKRGLSTKKLIDRTFFILWRFIEPLLFGLIGAEINFYQIDVSLLVEAVTVAFCGLVVRTTSVFFITLFLKFTWKERLFIVISWIPKATIQAAISGYPLLIAVDVLGPGVPDCELIRRLVDKVQAVAIFEIIVAAPVGALLIGLLGPRLLKKSGVDLREEERNEKTEEEIEEEQWIAEHPEEVNMEHYHHHHHDDLFEIHDPIPEVIHWSETHCLGCVHRAFQCLKGHKTHGEYDLNEVRTPKKSRSYPSNLNSPVSRSPASIRTNTPISPLPNNQEVWRLRYHSSATSRSPLVRSTSAPSTRSPFSPEQHNGGRNTPQQLFFRFPTISASSDEGEVPNLPQTHVNNPTLV